MIAISTAWNATQHSRARDIISEIKNLGFEWIELNFNLTPAIVNEMISLKDRGLIKVVSIHNFCPIPSGTSRREASPDIFSLSDLKEHRRQKAIFYTKKTIDTAFRIGAEVVVLHLGKVEMKEQTKKLASVYQAGDKQRYKNLKKQMLTERKEKSKKFFSQTLKSLKQLCAYAQKHKVKLGIENRYYFCEIPIIEEIETILATFPSPPLYYWHDVGHAQVYENLQFFKHKIILDRFSQRMVGIHLHDIVGINDHRAPLEGNFNFKQLKPYIKSKTIKVLEAHYPASSKAIIKSKKYLEKLFEKGN